MDVSLQLVTALVLSFGIVGIGHGHLFLKNSTKRQQEHQSSFEFAVDSTTQINDCERIKDLIKCRGNERYLRVGFCATYDNSSGLTSVALCPYFKPDHFNVTRFNKHGHYVQLPRNLSELNDYVCEPLKRRGRVCSECMDGYGPAVMSVGFDIQCASCTGSGYEVVLFLFLELFPATLFYLVILIFQVNITSGTITCYIMYSQLAVMAYDRFTAGDIFDITDIFVTARVSSLLHFNLLLTAYDVWNLRFFCYLLPPFCVSSRLKPIHLIYLSYLSVLYPLCLIAATWVGVELYDRNFKPFVCLCRPLVTCLVRVRRSWNARNDLINVFASFFLLSFSKVLFQFVYLLTYQKIYGGDSMLVLQYDLSVPYGSVEHIAFAAPSVFFGLVFVVLPTLLLIFYPFRVFRALLSKCRLDGIVLYSFVEKFYSCYRNGLNGGKDMRSFAGLYFVVRIAMLAPNIVGGWFHISQDDPFYLRNIIFTTAAVLVGLCRPYKAAYMNILDTIFLVFIGLYCHLVSSYAGFEHEAYFMIAIEVMFALPFFGFVLYVLVVKIAVKTGIVRMLLQMCKKVHYILSTREGYMYPVPHCSTEGTAFAEVSADSGSIYTQ